jgi:hypothetical protein
MSIFVYGSWLALSVVGEISTVDQITSQGANLGNLSSAGIWALVALVSVIGLVYVYRQKSKDDEELKIIIKDTTAAITKNSEVLEKLDNNISNCPKR